MAYNLQKFMRISQGEYIMTDTPFTFENFTAELSELMRMKAELKAVIKYRKEVFNNSQTLRKELKNAYKNLATEIDTIEDEQQRKIAKNILFGLTFKRDILNPDKD